MERRVFLLSAFPSFENQPDEKIYYEQVERFGIPDCFEALEDCARKEASLREHLLPVCVEALLARIVSMSDTCLLYTSSSFLRIRFSFLFLSLPQ